MMHNHIVIEGPLGVGKTSLTLMLAEKLNGQALLEDTEENPFLTKFYQNPEKYGFQTQIYFLLRRYQQALEMRADGAAWDLLSACEARAGNYDRAHDIQQKLSSDSPDRDTQQRRQLAMAALRRRQPLNTSHVGRALVA